MKAQLGQTALWAGRNLPGHSLGLQLQLSPGLPQAAYPVGFRPTKSPQLVSQFLKLALILLVLLLWKTRTHLVFLQLPLGPCGTCPAPGATHSGLCPHLHCWPLDVPPSLTRRCWPARAGVVCSGVSGKSFSFLVEKDHCLLFSPFLGWGHVVWSCGSRLSEEVQDQQAEERQQRWLGGWASRLSP